MPAHPLPPALRDKVGKLLPMLSSDRDGKRAGAVAAKDRVFGLKAKGATP